jgi:hypothetical protein
MEQTSQLSMHAYIICKGRVVIIIAKQISNLSSKNSLHVTAATQTQINDLHTGIFVTMTEYGYCYKAIILFLTGLNLFLVLY